MNTRTRHQREYEYEYDLMNVSSIAPSQSPQACPKAFPPLRRGGRGGRPLQSTPPARAARETKPRTDANPTRQRGALAVAARRALTRYFARQRWGDCRAGATHPSDAVSDGLHPPYK